MPSSPDVMYTIPVRVYYEDTDATGIVYHANYLKYMERCRSDWLHERGCDVERVRERFGVVFILRRATLEYLAPARLWDALSVALSVVRLGKVTLDLEQSVQRGDETLCRAGLRLASLEPRSLKPRVMPDDLLSILQRHE